MKHLLALAILALPAAHTHAEPTSHPRAEAQALALAKASMALRSVTGPNNQTPQVAQLYRDTLLASGFADGDISITRMEGTAYLIARWRGTDSKLKPLVIEGHMDVVEAKPSDWKRDPFTPVEENGYLYGRGASDMKMAGALGIASLIELRRQGFRPHRDIILAFSGDEESTMHTSAKLAETLAGAEMMLNLDAGGGLLDEETGRPRFWTWHGAEKTYADFELTVTDPGGHSSAPTGTNAITALSRALARIGGYRFKPEVNALTRAAFLARAPLMEPPVGAAYRAFAMNPEDEAAIKVLSARPASVGQIGTTCVVTMISGGHAPNALPQRATANVNCRIFPGHKPAEIMAELRRVANEPSVTFRDITGDTAIPSDPSPMRADVQRAFEHAIAASYPGTAILPSMGAGASDSMWFRARGVPSYGASPIMMKDSDDYSHGLDERVPLTAIRPSVGFLLTLFGELSS